MFPSSLCRDTGRLLPTDREVISPSADKTPSLGARTHLHYHWDHVRLWAADIHETHICFWRKKLCRSNNYQHLSPGSYRSPAPIGWRFLGQLAASRYPPVGRLYDGMGEPPHSDISACLASLDCSLGPKWKRCPRRCFSGDARAKIGCLSIRSLLARSIFWN